GRAERVAVEHDRACIYRLETGDRAQRRGLAAAARSEQAGDVSGRNAEAEVLEYPLLAVTAGDGLDVELRAHECGGPELIWRARVDEWGGDVMPCGPLLCARA